MNEKSRPANKGSALSSGVAWIIDMQKTFSCARVTHLLDDFDANTYYNTTSMHSYHVLHAQLYAAVQMNKTVGSNSYPCTYYSRYMQLPVVATSYM